MIKYVILYTTQGCFSRVKLSVSRLHVVHEVILGKVVPEAVGPTFMESWRVPVEREFW